MSTLSPRDFKGPMTLFLLKTESNGYPIPATAIRLLMVTLATMAPQAGNMLKKSGGGKNSHKYPPTMNPIGKAPNAQPVKR
jgi:hypothetical protein